MTCPRLKSAGYVHPRLYRTRFYVLYAKFLSLTYSITLQRCTLYIVPRILDIKIELKAFSVEICYCQTSNFFKCYACATYNEKPCFMTSCVFLIILIYSTFFKNSREEIGKFKQIMEEIIIFNFSHYLTKFSLLILKIDV